MELEEIWKEIDQQEQDGIRYLTIGPLHVWLQVKNSEVWICHTYEQDLPANFNTDMPPDELTWTRHAPKGPSNRIRLVPVFPDLPLVVGTEHHLTLAPGARIQIYSRVPVWTRFLVPGDNYVMTEIPTIKLSRTWFGTPLEGELCYWLTTKARRSLTEAEWKGHVVNCPIHITNRSQEDLNFEKFCYRVERLGIYLIQNELWAGETKITYQGEDQHSDIVMTGKPPSELSSKHRKELSKPRNPASSNIASRTFRRLFDDSNFTAR